ncbi:hypothetical protein [Spiroplasma turonicum]|uniref:Uncharacterized protein n=1 Tax=Spiroplasma turonicum TaxID=216946 RepID=A0A0K1P791_9MOLU|nr:hypothetical protein [Spiroplasma turonicum]AKU80191.1 hypothetical protein STURON_00945 [Spiroplasma turonicum]ALX71191.1 hypothetical protein STURO_v1c09400 [Spiroplasma turonicum]
MFKNDWNELIEAANKVLNNFSKNNKKIIKSLTNFGKKIVKVSSSYIENRKDFFEFIEENYTIFSEEAIKIYMNADIASLIMQLNEGSNDYLILINVFKSLLHSLDSLKKKNLINCVFSLIDREEIDIIKELVYLKEKAIFSKKDKLSENLKKVFKKQNLNEDNFFEMYVKLDFWNDIKALVESSLDTYNYGSNYFKELLSNEDGFEEDMIINIWALLSINLCYLDYLNLNWRS